MKYSKVNEILLNLHKEYSKLDTNQKEKQYFFYLKELRKLAYKNHGEAQLDLAGHYDDIGYWGVPNPYYNAKKKCYWFNKSAQNNNSEAYNNLAVMYENGEYVRQDLFKALELYKTGMGLGSKNCKNNYRTLKRQLKLKILKL